MRVPALEAGGQAAWGDSTGSADKYKQLSNIRTIHYRCMYILDDMI